MSGKRLLVMAGGTGGHVFPALAVADQLMKQGWQVRWLGTADRMEAHLVPNAGIDIDFIQIKGIRGKGLKALLFAPWPIFKAWLQARKIIKSWQPDVVLGMGGYVSGPGGLAAWSCGIPVVLHEQNGVAGLTNQWLAKIASQVLQAFPGALADAEVVGNPVRQSVLEMPCPEQRLALREGPLRVLVMGGSQGARILNQTLPEVAAILGDKIQIRHQTGKGALQQVQDAYNCVGQPQHQVIEFIDDVTEAYSWADVLVCRAGALTVSEVAVAGLPAIFVPFQHKDRQQYWNALPLEQAAAASIIEQPQFNARRVAQLLQSWDRATLRAMAIKARTVAITDASERVAQAVVAAVKADSRAIKN